MHTNIFFGFVFAVIASMYFWVLKIERERVDGWCGYIKQCFIMPFSSVAYSVCVCMCMSAKIGFRVYTLPSAKEMTEISKAGWTGTCAGSQWWSASGAAVIQRNCTKRRPTLQTTIRQTQQSRNRSNGSRSGIQCNIIPTNGNDEHILLANVIA